MAISPADSPAGKAFTGLAHMVAAAVPEGRSVILVTGTSSRPGASLVAANLAAGLARTHPPVALVCADMPGSVAPRVAGVAARPGLAELMAGRLAASEVAARGAVTNLSVVTPGVDGMADTAIQQDVMERLVGTLRPEARFVVIEAPPLAEAGDIYALAPLAAVTLIVAEVGLDARPELVSGVEQLEQLGTSVLGVVLVPTLRDDGQGTYAPGARARPAMKPRAWPPPRPGTASPGRAGRPSGNYDEPGHGTCHAGLTAVRPAGGRFTARRAMAAGVRRPPATVTPGVLAALAVLCALAGGCARAPALSQSAQGRTASPTAATTAPAAPVGHPAPLTGSNEAGRVAGRPAVAVPVSGADPAGLASADLVFEESGSSMRYLAVFQSTDAGLIGPVAATLPSDGQLLSALHPVTGYAGRVCPVRPGAGQDQGNRGRGVRPQQLAVRRRQPGADHLDVRLLPCGER